MLSIFNKKVVKYRLKELFLLSLDFFFTFIFCGCVVIFFAFFKAQNKGFTLFPCV